VLTNTAAPPRIGDNNALIPGFQTMTGHGPTAEWYRQQADECFALAKAAIAAEVRALYHAMAERYLRLAGGKTPSR
jgi:hypothetical protein